jgi:hypothetical protein
MSTDRIEALIARAGRTIVLRRLTGTQGIPFDAQVTASIRGYQPQELVGPVQQGDREVTLSPAELRARQWTLPPRRNDKAVIDDAICNVEAVETRHLGEEVAFYVLRVRG